MLEIGFQCIKQENKHRKISITCMKVSQQMKNSIYHRMLKFIMFLNGIIFNLNTNKSFTISVNKKRVLEIHFFNFFGAVWKLVGFCLQKWH